MGRLAYALETGAITLPETGTIAVVSPPGDYDLSALPRDRLVLVTKIKPDHDDFLGRGIATDVILPEAPAAVVVVAGRAKERTREEVAMAALTGAALIVDGGRAEGIDSLYRDLKKTAEVTPAVAKAHGKVFGVAPGADLTDWLTGPRDVEGFRTVPGVFSADGIDPASRLLADALPPLKGSAADLGAGWGYLAHRVLAASPDLAALHLVEADADALACAKDNVTDPRAAFHWEDVRRWKPPAPLDAVVTNPPFHAGRRADPDLGRAFIRAAARMLTPKGSLWLVANRHLPYEATLKENFRDLREVGGNPAFKVFEARRPRTAA